MRLYDRTTGNWYEAEMDKDGNLVEVPSEIDIVEEAKAASGTPQDATKTRYGSELEEAAKFAMQEEQKKNGFQDEVTTGLMLATQTPEDEKLVRSAGERSLKQQLIVASDILTEKASEMHDKDPKLASMYSDYSQKMRSLGDQISSKFQDTWFGTNLRYNTPIGSGSEGVPYSSRFSGVNDYVRPELEGKTYEQAMNDTLETSFGKQTLANRIDERKRYMKDNPNASVLSGFLPITSQWKDMKEEGLDLKDLSAGGAARLAGSAALQGGSMLLRPTPVGAVLSVGAGTAADMLSRPERADSDEAMRDAIAEAVGSAVGGAFPAGVSKLGKMFKGAKAKKAARISGASNADDPRILTKIEQNKKLIDDLNSKIDEGRLVIAGNPEAMQNAFVKAAGPDVAPEQAWMYSKGFMMGPEGQVSSKQVPWVRYALDEENRLGREQTKNIEKLNKKKLAEGDAELLLRQQEASKPSGEKAVSSEKELKALQDLYDEKVSTRLEDLEDDIQFYKKSLESVKTDPKANMRASTISYLESRLAALENELPSLNEGTAKHSAKVSQIARAKAALKKARADAKSMLESSSEDLKKKLDRLQKKYDKNFESLGGEPTTAGFQTKKRLAEEAKASFAQNQEKYSMGVERKQKELDNLKSQISELESLIAKNQDDLAMLKSDETQASFRKGAESILKKEFSDADEKLNAKLASAKREEESLQSALEQSRAKRAVGTGRDADKRRTNRILRGFGVNIGGDIGNSFAYKGHEDYNAKNDRSLGTWVDQAIAITLGKLLPLPYTTQQRVNRFRGFKK
jgi:hypothetical protein